MTAPIPSKVRALAHRRIALDALHADSSLSSRLKRYNHHIVQMGVLETRGGAQLESPTVDLFDLEQARDSLALVHALAQQADRPGLYQPQCWRASSTY